MEYRTLHAEELNAWYTHCGLVFQEDPGYFRMHFEQDPARALDLIFVAVTEGQIVATVRVFPRTMWLAGRRVDVGGIGEVSTNPHFERQGHAAQLLHLAIGAMERRDMPVSMLFASAHAFYRKFGWEVAPIAQRAIATTDLPSLPEEYEVRAWEPSDLPVLQGMYDLYAGRFSGQLLRDPAYWKTWVMHAWRQQSVDVLVGSEGVKAYLALRSSHGEGAYILNELAACPEQEGLLPALAGEVARRCGAYTLQMGRDLLPGYGTPVPDACGRMLRLNQPLGEIKTTQALCAQCAQSTAFFDTDGF